MRRLAILAAGLLLAAGSFVALRALSDSSAPRLRVLSRSKLERERLGYWRIQPASRHPGLPQRLAQPMTETLRDGGVQVVGVGRYGTPPRGPAIDLAVSDPAGFLKYRLERIVRATRGYKTGYIRIVDDNGAPVLEWHETDHGGSLFVRRGLEGCSPIVAPGWQNVPSCPLS